MGANEQTYRVIAVSQPSRTEELVFVAVTLENMMGEQKQERITFTDAISAWEFYRAQKNMLIKQKNSKFLDK